MPARHRSRQRAVQILFQADVRQQPVAAAIDSFYDTLYTDELQQETPVDEQPRRLEPDEFMETLARGTHGRLALIDEQITRHSANWRIERMPAVDRNILRLAIFEMQIQGTPAPVVIDEALELGREFSAPESVSFINGVLDAIRRGAPQEPPEGVDQQTGP
jgi:transcription antitermination protein NusB